MLPTKNMITEKDVEKIARLAKLSLTDAEKKHYAGELTNILGFAEKLDQLDLKNVEATSHAVEMTNVFRKDEAVKSTVSERIIAQSPAHDETLFRVPKIIG